MTLHATALGKQTQHLALKVCKQFILKRLEL